MGRLKFRRTAVFDLNGIFDYIAQDNPKRAHSFVGEIEDTCRIWSDTPFAGHNRSDLSTGLRSFPHGNYVIFFRPMKDGIAIIRVLHAKRDLSRLFD